MLPNFDTLFDQIRAFKKPPIHAWHPEKTVPLDLTIEANGEWFYQGSMIKRHRLVKLFATVLRLDGDGRHYLVTPEAKYAIEVKDAPFMAIELNRQTAEGEPRLYFRTNMDEVVMADVSHPIFMSQCESTKEMLPYVLVRDGLIAKLNRSVFYELADLVEPIVQTKVQNKMKTEEEEVGTRSWGVYSAGVCFPLGEG